MKTIQVDASKDCYMLLDDLVSEQVRYGHRSRCATANHTGLLVGSAIDLWFPIQSFGNNNNLFEFVFIDVTRKVDQLSFICVDKVDAHT